MRVAVIGVGAMGRNHARVYNELDHAELVAVADSNPVLADKVAHQFRTRSYADYRELLAKEKLDAVTIAVPSSLHLAVARDVVDAGVPMLIEKPIAATVAEAQEVIELAKKKDVFLTVGHIERFNPAILELKRRLDAGALGRIFELRARRLGPFPARVRDVGVVLDLAPHDLDIMRYLTNAEVIRVYAETARRIHTEHEDLVSGVLSFANGIVGALEINWLTPTKVREISVTGERGMFVASYLTQELFFYENSTTEGEWSSLRTLTGVSEGEMVKPSIQVREPLRVELETFLGRVARKELPAVTGEDGMRALLLAQKLVESGLTHRVVQVS